MISQYHHPIYDFDKQIAETIDRILTEREIADLLGSELPAQERDGSDFDCYNFALSMLNCR